MTLAPTSVAAAGDAARDSATSLAVVGIHKAFGGIQALTDCSLTVTKGSITALIGPNGSGKTTLFNCISGFYEPDRGQVYVGGTPVVGRQPSDIVHLGLMRTFQVTRIFRRMTVLENMIVPIRQLTFRALFTAAIKGHERERAESLLEFVGLLGLRDHQAGSLSFGQQKLLELAAALMAEPEIVLLDEPAGGLNPIMIDKVAGHVRELNGRGVTFLIIEHNMGFVMNLCDPVIVMHRGTVIAQGTPAAVREDPMVLDAYLGD